MSVFGRIRNALRVLAGRPSPPADEAIDVSVVVFPDGRHSWLRGDGDSQSRVLIRQNIERWRRTACAGLVEAIERAGGTIAVAEIRMRRVDYEALTCDANEWKEQER